MNRIAEAKRSLASLVLLFAVHSSADAAPKNPSVRYAAPAAEGEFVSVAISNGDNDILYTSPPVDSAESIGSYFDILKKVYGVRRVYWRGAQIEELTAFSTIRPGNVTWYPLGDYLRRLYSNADTNPTRIAVAAAKERGMEIWGWAALFDHGSQEATDSGKGTGPSPVESKLRLEHPEWIPTDRHGIRRMSGAISFSFPQARKALVDLYTRLAVEGGYDGMTFHTYIEQFAMRNEDEFGFSAPVVEEYRKRYGTDLLKEPFDPEKLAAVRGHFLTLFFRELRASFQPHGIKIGLWLDPRRPDYPAPWLSSRKRDFSPAGRIRIDWRRYIDEGLVDELTSYVNGPNTDFAAALLERSRGKGVQTAILHSSAYPKEVASLAGKGVNRMIAGAYPDLEYGYFEKKDERLLQTGDFIEKLTVLRQMETGVTKLDPAALIHATRDARSWVRRRAIEVLLHKKIAGPAALNAIAECLKDPATGVRSYAVAAALALGGSDLAPEVFESVASHFDPPVTTAALGGLANLSRERTPDLILALKHPDSRIRYLGLQAFGRGARRPQLPPEYFALASDADARVRWAVAANVTRFRTPEAGGMLLKLLADPHPTVRAMAAVQLGNQYKSASLWLGKEQFTVFTALAKGFLRHGDACKEPDAAWGWRPLGEALEKMGPRGREVLERCLAQGADVSLAEHAWNVLYIKTASNTFLPVSNEEVEHSLAAHPRLRGSVPAPPASRVEPEFMPYIVHDFSREERAPGKDGSLGNSEGEEGLWRGVEGRLASGEVRLDGEEKPGRKYVEGMRGDNRPDTGKLIARIGLRPERAGKGLLIWMTNSARFSSSLQLYIDPACRLWATDGEGRRQDTGRTLEPGRDCLLEIAADLDRHRYTVGIGTPGGVEPLLTNVPLKPGEAYNAIAFLPGASPDTLFHLKSVDIRISNPAFHSAPAAAPR